MADAALQTELTRVNASAATAMRELATWLESERSRATNDFALGAAMYSRMLAATESVDVPLKRLAAIGQADLERNTAALRDACGLFAGARSPPARQGSLAQRRRPRGAQPAAT